MVNFSTIPILAICVFLWLNILDKYTVLIYGINIHIRLYYVIFFDIFKANKPFKRQGMEGIKK